MYVSIMFTRNCYIFFLWCLDVTKRPVYVLIGDGAVGISWSQRYPYCQAQAPPPSQEGSLGYYTTDCVAPLPHLYMFAALQVSFLVALDLFVHVFGSGMHLYRVIWQRQCCQMHCVSIGTTDRLDQSL